MGQEGTVPVDERIRRDWVRLRDIQKNGRNVKKLMISLKRITNVSKKAKPEDISRALEKLEKYLTRIEGQISEKTGDSTPPKTEENEKGEIPPDAGYPEEDKKMEPESPEPEIPSAEGLPPEPVRPDVIKNIRAATTDEVPEKKEEIPADEQDTSSEGEKTPADVSGKTDKVEEEERSPMESPEGSASEEIKEEKEKEAAVPTPEEETPTDEKSEEETVVTESATEQEKEEVGPAGQGQVSEETTSEDIDVKDGEQPDEVPDQATGDEAITGEPEETHIPIEEDEEVKSRLLEIEELKKEVSDHGGDSSPINGHLDAMKDSVGRSDRNMFQQYYEISRDWFLKYIRDLLKMENVNLAERIKDLSGKYGEIGKMERIEGKVPDIQAILNDNKSDDMNILRDINTRLTGGLERIDDDMGRLTVDMESEVSETISKLGEKLSKIQDEEKKKDLKKRMDDVVTHISEDVISAYKGLKTVQKEITREAGIEEKKRFDSILKSMEPILSSISDIEEKEDEKDKEGTELARERDRLVVLFQTDIDEAMKGMEDLLDRSAERLANLEEKISSDIEDRIASVKSDIDSISDMIDTSPAKNILEKASEAFGSGDMEKSRDLLDKASSALKRLKDKGAREKAMASLDEIKNRKKELEDLTIDTTPLEQPLQLAENSIETGDLDDFERHLKVLRDRISSMKNEELRMEYQQMLIRIMNEIKKLKENGIESEPFEEELSKVKELFLSKDLGGSLELQKDLLSRIKKKRLSKNVDERIRKVEETLDEAEGLLVDIEKPRQNLEQAREMIEKGVIEEALDLLVETQVDIEYRMTTRTFSMIEKEIRDVWEEAKQHSIEVGDVESSIQKAYNMADDDMYREALEHLHSIKEGIMEELNQTKAVALLDDLADLIKKARSLGLKIATFKASHTKARVLIEAGDHSAGIDLIERQIQELEDRISNRKELQDRLDSLRGKLIGMESKIARIVDRGLPVSMFRESMKEIQELIDLSEVDSAEEKFKDLDRELDRVMKGGNQEENARKEVPQRETPSEERSTDVEEDIDPATAKSKLFDLVAQIRDNMKKRSSEGKDVTTIKKDIQSIQEMVIRKDYISAYRSARSCLDRLME